MDGLYWRGVWSPNIKYGVNDVVYFVDNGFTYVCVRENRKGFTPDNDYSGFELMAGFRVDEVDIASIDGGNF